MHIVLDTNVLVAGLAAYHRGQTPPARILKAWIDRAFDLCSSEPLIRETINALHKPYFAERVLPELIALIMAGLEDDASITALTVRVDGVATHPEDDLILATALSAKADLLVTGDRQLQKLGTFHGVTILSPAEFIDLLDQQANS